jgi:hypothetical protein
MLVAVTRRPSHAQLETEILACGIAATHGENNQRSLG